MNDQLTPLFRRGDGFAEDGNGNFCVVMLANDGAARSGMQTFTFRPSLTAEAPIIVQWAEGSSVALLPFDLVSVLVKKGYGRNMTEEEVEGFNEYVESLEQPPAQPVPASPTKTAPATPAPAPTPPE